MIAEDHMGKQVGLAILKEILEGLLKPFGVAVERGFMYKKKLSFVPDYVLTFPNDKKWAVDYHTSILRGKDTTFVNQMKRRKTVYESEGFLNFSFVAESWLTINKDTGKGTLAATESTFVMKNEEDFVWDEFLFQLEPECLDLLNDTLDTDSLEVDTRSIQYLNIRERTCKIVRFLETADSNERNSTIKVLTAPITIPLTRALKLNEAQTSFELAGEQENSLRDAFKQKLIVELEESKVSIEPVRVALPDYPTPPSKEEHLRNIMNLPFYQKMADKQTTSSPSPVDYDAEDEEVKRRMARVAEIANQRPIELNEYQWNQQLYGNPTQRMTPYAPNYSAVEKTTPKVKDHYYEKKRKQLKEKLLDASIPGGHYIGTEGGNWKAFILTWISR